MKRSTKAKMNRLISVVTFIAAGSAVFDLNRLPAAASSGADVFKSKCAACHAPDGSGNTPMGQKLKVRDLHSADVQKQSDADLTAIITNGKPPMPAYGKTLSSADIQELVAYIRSLAKS
jgi:cytochrome c6